MQIEYKTYLNSLQTTFASGKSTEHSFRPFLKNLLEELFPKHIATNEPRRQKCGAPDFIVTKNDIQIGYIETKDLQTNLNKIHKTEQIQRYFALGNLILTNYLEFQWFEHDQLRQEVVLGTIQGNKIIPNSDAVDQLHTLFCAFNQSTFSTISNPKELAMRLADLAKLIRYTIENALIDDESSQLYKQLEAFRRVLLPELDKSHFADMYAQTICYGLFSAKCSMDTKQFNRQNAGHLLPKSNPFLRKFFQQIAGYDLDNSVAWAVDRLCDLLNHSDMSAILKNFGTKTRQEDPVVHFYETFLQEYNPRLREMRGVYYTPEPVVYYITRSIDFLLKNDFLLPNGLADSTTVTVKDKNKVRNVHKVQILDPATGTGTFLYGVVKHIQEQFGNNKGLWAGYIKDHLLPRLYGFELLMAPYVIAHMKLDLLLAESGVTLDENDRLQVYLTNTLQDLFNKSEYLLAEWLSDEANQAINIKRDYPVMVILGNPPYSGESANQSFTINQVEKGEICYAGWEIDNNGVIKNIYKTATKQLIEKVPNFIGELLRSYYIIDGQKLNEKNTKWLQDDYVKFFRFAQWRIEQTGYGILAFITNHSYLDNPTFCGMRQSLLQTFDDMFILNLHGNAKKKETAPDGGKDENVFDIQQGVAIGIYVKHNRKKKGFANLFYADQYGEREIYDGIGEQKQLIGGKYHYLLSNSIQTTKWTKLKPSSPNYLFIPLNTRLKKEYDSFWKITDIMSVNSVGVVTARDSLTIQKTPEAMWSVVKDFASLRPEEARDKYHLGKDAQDWVVETAQKDLKVTGLKKSKIVPIAYRPFDVRYTYFTGHSNGFHCRPRNDVMSHMFLDINIALVTCRQQSLQGGWHLVGISNQITESSYISNKTAEINSVFPLYLLTDNGSPSLFDVPHEDTEGLSPNFAEEWIEELKTSIGLTRFIYNGKTDKGKSFNPENVLHYIYAILHAPSYRTRYAEFLKLDFPRIPLPSNLTMFRKLSKLGETLCNLHLMKQTVNHKPNYPIEGSNTIEEVRYTEPIPKKQNGRVWINKTQYFDPVSLDVWNFYIGGYQVCLKWLKDRKGVPLEFNEIEHYQNIISVISETLILMEQVDCNIKDSFGW